MLSSKVLHAVISNSDIKHNITAGVLLVVLYSQNVQVHHGSEELLKQGP